MKMVLLALLFWGLPVVGVACRCAPLPMATYFDMAEFVAMARLTGVTQNDDKHVLDFELMTSPHKGGEPEDRTGALVRLNTALSTAACGVFPESEAVYILFAARREDGSLWIDTCGGTRTLLTQEGKHADFIDVPARFVPSQLNAMQGMTVLREVSRNAPEIGNPGNDSLIGLLDLKALAHGGNVRVFDHPGGKVLAMIERYEALEHREYSYELPGAVVFAHVDGWFRVRKIDGTFGWVSPEAVGTYFRYDELPVRRLAYLTGEWSGLSWPGPGSGIPNRTARYSDGRALEIPINVLESSLIGGMPWFRIEILDADPCSGAESGSGRAGWVPAYGQRGRPNVWFYSRGC